MANFVYITLDTTAPKNVVVKVNNGATYASKQIADLLIGTSDSETIGYQLKIWGDVDNSNDSNVQTLEEDSKWISYDTVKQIKLSEGDGSKSVNIKVRDDVWNESVIASAVINLNTALPTITITSQDVTRISKVEGKNTVNFTFTSDVEFDEYVVKVVTSLDAGNDTGQAINIESGSKNVFGNEGDYNTPITVTIKGEDLELANIGDGQKIVKVFVKSKSGIWSA